MTSAWGTQSSSAWADEVDQQEARNGKLDDAFPTLGEAAKAEKGGKGKKKSVQKMSFADFLGNGRAAGGDSFAAGSDKSILMSLPTAPRGRVEGEESFGLGGGFNKFGDRDDRCKCTKLLFCLSKTLERLAVLLVL